MSGDQMLLVGHLLSQDSRHPPFDAPGTSCATAQTQPLFAHIFSLDRALLAYGRPVPPFGRNRVLVDPFALSLRIHRRLV